MLKISHEVVRPGQRYGEAEVTIPIPEELATVPGIPLNQREVDWYAREYPLETMNITERASRDWANTLRDQHAEMREIRKEHDKLNSNLIMATRQSVDIEPTAKPTGEDVSEKIKTKARELGFLEVGLTAYDVRYDYQAKKGVAKYPHAICLAYEQDYEPTQTIPSIDAEIVHSSTYRTQAAAALELGSFINGLGYHAQVIHSSDSTGPVILLEAIESAFNVMPHGTEFESAFDSFKEKARAAGGEITDEIMEEFRQEMASRLGNETTDQLVMMDQDADYI